MAIYHLHIKIAASRGKGKSAVSAAAYRSGEKIKSDYDGNTHDYTRKGGVVHTEIMLPQYAPLEYADHSVLWNAVEKIEKAKNAQLAREIEIALPKELSAEKNISLVREYVNHTFVEQGMCADVCIHDTGAGNPHAHIMLTMRPFNEDGTWGDKQKKEYILDGNGEKIYDKKKRQYKCKSIPTTDWNEQTKAEEWRAAWADCVNRFLESENITERIDHRSYERQGIEQIPTVHMGVAANQMERRGIHTERGDMNREITITNRQMGQLRARIKKCKDWLYSKPLVNPPTLMSMMEHIADGKNLLTQSQRIKNLKTQAHIFMFLQNNDIYDVEQLANKIEHIHRQFYDVSSKIKSVNRRLDTLNEHLTHYDNYNQNKAVYNKYIKLDPNKRKDFYKKHSDEIQLYKESKEYLDKIMNGKKDIPIKAWKKEQTELLAERYDLMEKHYQLKDETRSVELLRKGAENIMSENVQETALVRKHGINL